MYRTWFGLLICLSKEIFWIFLLFEGWKNQAIILALQEFFVYLVTLLLQGNQILFHKGAGKFRNQNGEINCTINSTIIHFIFEDQLFDHICIYSACIQLLTATIQRKFWWFKTLLSCKKIFMAKRNWINCPFCRHRLFFVVNPCFAQPNAVRKTKCGPSLKPADSLRCRGRPLNPMLSIFSSNWDRKTKALFVFNDKKTDI